MEPKMTILFIGKKSRTTRYQLLPIYLRVTIEGKRFEVATHRHVEQTEWCPSSGKAKGRSDSATETNMALDIIKKKVYEYKEQLNDENRDFTVNLLREKWFGQDRNKRTLLGVFRSRIMDFERLVTKGVYRKSTLTKYKSTEKHLLKYLEWQNMRQDILLVDLRIEFAANFEYYLQAEKGLSTHQER